ncbi:MAG TPA: 2-oxo acid dehydrogenase subunit E2 [Candidatus Acidoferrales bacterium]|nr:2-oxo acid dehydrogenase subunit E2 [Candidatus Acidoferrales bacterium]
MATEFKLPELGENIESGDLIKILVSVGDRVEKDQPVIELETEKATIEVPSPVSGTVKEIHVKAGQKIKVGQLVLTVEDGAAGKAEAKVEKKAEPAPTAPEEKAKTAMAPAAVRPPAPPPRPEAPREVAPAAPSVRRLARELGIDINKVPGSGPGGRISDEDVKAYAKHLITEGAAARPTAAPAAAPLPDFSKWGEIERKPMSNVRRKTAEHMSHAWTTIPHVTHYDKADITELEQFRKRHSEQAKAAGGKLTVTAVALKVVASALKVFPQFAASIDVARDEIVYKKYCHIGVAVDTDRGLLVPVIRDADKKNIIELAVELQKVSEKARSKKLTLEDMTGGVFTITNLGGLGGTAFSPIVNAPEVAILGMARGSVEPIFLNGLFQPRLMLPLSLSYDHRLIDGADAARFLRWVAEALEQLSLLPLQG